MHSADYRKRLDALFMSLKNVPVQHRVMAQKVWRNVYAMMVRFEGMETHYRTHRRTHDTAYENAKAEVENSIYRLEQEFFILVLRY